MSFFMFIKQGVMSIWPAASRAAVMRGEARSTQRRCAICLDSIDNLVPTHVESGRYGFVFEIKCKCEEPSSRRCGTLAKCDENTRYVIKKLHKGEEDTVQSVRGVEYESSTTREIENEITFASRFVSNPNFVQIAHALPSDGVLLLEYAGEPLIPTEEYPHLELLMRDADVILKALREARVVHRDIYKRNLCVAPEGTRLVLIDFGRAANRNTLHHRLVGEFSAPWIARGEDDEDDEDKYRAHHRDDQWGMALTFLQVVHGSDLIHPMCRDLSESFSHQELVHIKNSSVQNLYRSPKHLSIPWRTCFDNIFTRQYHTKGPRISELYGVDTVPKPATVKTKSS